MYNSMKKIILSVFLASVSFTQSFGWGAHGSQAKSTYLQFSYKPVIAEAYFDNDGDVVDGPKYTKNAIGLFFGYGLWHEDLTLIGAIDFLHHEIEGIDDKAGFSDATLELDYRFLKSDFKMGAGLEFGLPTGTYEKADELSRGDGEFDVRLKVYSNYNSWDFELGYRKRFENYTDDFSFGVQYKHQVKSMLILTYGLRGQFLTGDANEELISRYSDFGEGVGFLSPYISAFYSLSSSLHLTLTFAAGSGGLFDRNLVAAPYIIPALAMTF